MRPVFALRTLLPLAALAALAGCAGDNQLDLESGVGITASRSLCPAVGIPVHTGDVTLFNPAGSTTSNDIDVVATITNVRSTCSELNDRINGEATFAVIATRTKTDGARTIQLPYFSTVVQGGAAVVAKKVGWVTLSFAPGQRVASTQAQASASVSRAALTLPDDIRERITRRRRAGDADAAIDPMSIPEVKAAVARATFELLVGFQLTDAQLRYNATR